MLREWETRQEKAPAELARCLYWLGTWCCELAYFEKAEAYFRRAFDIVCKRLDLSSPDGLIITADLSLAYVRLRKIDEAALLLESAISRAEKRPRLASLTFARCLHQLANLRRDQERYIEAEAILRRAMALVQESVPDSPIALRGSHHLLGVILRHQGRWAEAEECFRETLRLCEEYAAPEDLAIARASEGYAELLALMGRTEEAHEHQHHAKQIRDFHAPL